MVASLRKWWGRGTLWNACGHCSSCFATVEKMRSKMDRFTHKRWNTVENRDANPLVDRVRHESDVFGRDGEIYDKTQDNGNVPLYILHGHGHKGRFSHLLDRNGDDAGLKDIPTIDRKHVQPYCKESKAGLLRPQCGPLPAMWHLQPVGFHPLSAVA